MGGRLDFGLAAELRRIPLVGYLFRLVTRPLTYYRVDALQVFHKIVHDAVTDALDAVLLAKGKRALTEDERRTHLRDFLDKVRRP